MGLMAQYTVSIFTEFELHGTIRYKAYSMLFPKILKRRGIAVGDEMKRDLEIEGMTTVSQ